MLDHDGPDVRLAGIQFLHDPEDSEKVSRSGLYNWNDFENAPRYLSITARMATVRIVTRAASEEPRNIRRNPYRDPDYLFAFPLDDDLDIILNPALAELPATLLSNIPVRGILFTSGVQDGATSLLKHPIILLVQRQGRYYERVGILKLQVAWSHPPSTILPSPTLQFLQRSTGTFSQVELMELGRRHGVEWDDGADFPIWKCYVWERFFVEDTVVLG